MSGDIIHSETPCKRSMRVDPGWNQITFEGGACKQLVRFQSGLSAAKWSCQYS